MEETDNTKVNINLLKKVDELEEAIKKLEQEKAKLLGEISLKNINLIEVEKENNKLEEEKEEFIIYADKQSSVIAKYYGKTLVQENDITKLKQQVKELEEYSNHQGLTTHQRFLKMSEILNKNK